MFGKSVKISVAVLLLSVGVCLAQEKKSREKRQREPRPPRITEMGIQNTDDFLDRMKDGLHLTDSQQADFKKLLDGYKNELQSFRDEQRKQSGDGGADTASLTKQMEEARKANDPAREQQILEQMKANREKREAKEAPIRAGIEQATKKLHDKLAAGLGEKQKQGFEPLWEDAIAGRRSPLAKTSPKQLKELVMKLPKLTDDQKKKIEELFKASEKDTSGQKAGDRRLATEKVYDSVVAILTPEQKEKLLAEMGNRGKNRGGERQAKAETKGG